MKLLFRLMLISMFSFAYSDCLDIDNQIDCEASTDCEWHPDHSACEDAGTSDDGPDCIQDCTGVLDVDNEDINSVCGWFSSLGGVSNECFNDCSDEELEFPTQLESLCLCYALSESDCANSVDCSFGAWDETVACWPNFVFEEEEHCEDFLTEADCGMHTECEWHADDSACEDAASDHDHEHCDDITDETECSSSDHCEWHEGACEDMHCDEITDETECVDADHCQWHDGHCEDAAGDSDCADTDHINTDGLLLESHGTEVYSQFQGTVTGSVEVHMGHAEDFSIHFLDSTGSEIEVTDADCYDLEFNVADSSVLSIAMEESHDDHDHGDDHGDDDHDEHGALTFEITGLAVGSTTFTVSIMHNGHADYTSQPILVTVEEEEHCEDFLTEADCGMHTEC